MHYDKEKNPGINPIEPTPENSLETANIAPSAAETIPSQTDTAATNTTDNETNTDTATLTDQPWASNELNSDELEGEELPEKRSARQKVYDLGRGAYQFVLFPEAVHYQDAQGSWQDIDNTLEKQSINGRQRLTTRNNALTLSLAADAGAEDLVRLTNQKGQSIAWAVAGAQNTPAEHIETETEQLHSKAQARRSARRDMAENPSSKTATDEGKTASGQEAPASPLGHDALRSHPKTLESRQIYQNILPDTDLACHIRGTHFKDEFILKSPAAPRAITLNLQASQGLAWQSEGNGRIRVLDGAKTVYEMPPAFAVDADGQQGPVTTRLL